MDDPARPVTVLVVDDQPWVRVGLTSLLGRDPGLRVVGEAASGEEAIDVYGRAPCDVVLMDVRMPGMGGVR
ncbi:response regulator transcription factor, partial [Deinococcus pimensis]|uniref:response regulator transcription factor n=1 Tax=Deinococcus pimensis TaxID=309888 RepID=UPI0005EB92CB